MANESCGSSSFSRRCVLDFALFYALPLAAAPSPRVSSHRQNRSLALPFTFAACVEAHFSQHEHCPSCGKILTGDGLTIVEITNPATDDSAQATKLAAFQSLFKKESVNSRDLQFRGMCKRLFSQIDQVGQQTRFVINQLMKDAVLQARRNANAKTMNSKLQNQVEEKTQQLNSERQQFQAALENQVAKVNTHAQTICDLQQRLEEKEEMLRKFRERTGHMTVSSSNSVRSADERSYGSGGGRHRQQPVVTGPMQGIINQREAEARRLQSHLQPSQPQLLPRFGGVGGSGQSTVSEGYHSHQSGQSGNSNPMSRGRPASTMTAGGVRQGLHSGPSYHFSGSQCTHPNTNTKRRRVSHPQSTSGRSLASSSNGYGRYQQQHQRPTGYR